MPPRGYGGTELVCALLAEGLVGRGHDVTLVGAGKDRTSARFVRTFVEPPAEGSEDDVAIEVAHAARAATAIEALEVDIVHDHTRAGPLTAASRSCPTVVTVHAPLATQDSCGAIEAVTPWVSVVALSEAQRRAAPRVAWAAVVQNGIAVDQYPFRADKDDFVLYLGCMSAAKGVHLAIDAARKAGRRLVLAGSWTVPSERVYFDEEVRPRLGGDIEWVGEVGPREKAALLSRASCLVFPARWNEPFGLVLVEAMACGTPVVGLDSGAVREVVIHGETGLVCTAPAELPDAFAAATDLDPARCRTHVEERFSAARMVDEYEAIYRRLIASR